MESQGEVSFDREEIVFKGVVRMMYRALEPHCWLQLSRRER